MRAPLSIIAGVSLLLGQSARAQSDAELKTWTAEVIPAGYQVETIPLPHAGGFAVTGLGFFENGDACVATREGEVWRYDGQSWSQIASGLHEPTGLLVDPDTQDVLVSQKPELTRLIDENGDGVADVYQLVADEWGFSNNYHEYNHGLVQDSKGALYATLNLSHDPKSTTFRGKGGMGHATRLRGWAYRVSPEGEFELWASGLRSPCGIGINRDDELFYTDNQGDWVPTSTFTHLQRGKFHGHPVSLLDDPEFQGQDIGELTDEELAAMRVRPAVYIPHAELANSPGNPVWDYTGGKFGPFKDQVFLGDQSRSNIMRISLQKVGGVYQGAIFNFIDHLQSGAVRVQFSPDGELWVGQTGRGWGAVGGEKFGVQKIHWDGETTPFEILDMKLTKSGFRFTLTRPLAADVELTPASFETERWGYNYWQTYGSPRVDVTEVPVDAVTVSEDRKSFEVTLELHADQVYSVVVNGLKDADGLTPSTSKGFYTINELVK